MQKAQKLGLGAFVLLMGASLLAMRPHDKAATQDPKIVAAHLKLASLSTASRQDVDYRLIMRALCRWFNIQLAHCSRNALARF